MSSQERIKPSNEAEQLLLKFFGEVGKAKILKEVKSYRDKLIAWNELKLRVFMISGGVIHTSPGAYGYMSICMSWPKYPDDEQANWKRVMINL